MEFKHLLRMALAVTALAGLALTPTESFAKTTKTAKTKTHSAAKASSGKMVIRTASKSSKSSRHHHHHYASTPHQFSALVVDAETGHVLYEKNAGSIRYPASLTKMMTLYLTFEALKKNRISLDDEIPVSAKAAQQPQTNISLARGDKLPVRSAIESIVVRSANDSAVVLAEAVGGTAWNFALMMTKKAHELGMKDTVFRNPNGLPDNGQHTTAFDMARLAIALKRDFPEYYSFFSMRSFTYNGITYPGHNHVMERYPDMVDGVKTGYIRASGYNLVTSAHRDGARLVGVIMGGNTAQSRDSQMISMLDRTFAQIEGGEKVVGEGDMIGVSASLEADNSRFPAVHRAF